MLIFLNCFVFTALFEGKTLTVRLPVVDKLEDLNSFLEILFEELMCCEMLYSSQLLTIPCTKCPNNRVKIGKYNHATVLSTVIA